MDSISYAIKSADTVKSFIHAEVKGIDEKIAHEEEASESKAVNTKVSQSVQRLNVTKI